MDGDEKEAVKKRHLRTREVIDDEPSDHQANSPDGDEDLDLIEQALADLDEDDSGKAQEVTEDRAREILMTLIKQKVDKPVTMSYRQVQQQKREVRNARGFRPAAGGNNNSAVTMRRDLQQLKSVTRCKACGELGHWHRECPSKIPASSTGATASGASHSWWSLVQPSSDHPAAEAVESAEDLQAHRE